VRLFVAINFPLPVREAIFDETAPLRTATNGVRWVDAALLHLTVKFLGEQGESQVPELLAALERTAAQHAPVDAELTGVGAFPNLRRPRVVWMGMRDGDRLAKLANDVDRSCVMLGMPAEQRPFRAHLTLGRVRQELAIADAARLADAAAAIRTRQHVVIRSLELMRSDLSAARPVYSTLASLTMQGGTV
jgi:2'-5' RNA ligase